MTRTPWHEKYKVDVPEGESGNWRIERFTVSKKDAGMESFRAMFSFGGGRGVPEGTYTGLYRRGGIERWSLIMSDTPDEMRDHMEFVRRAKGRVLIHGLGLGMCAAAVLKKEELMHLTVVEISKDVVELVAPWLATLAEERDKGLEIIVGDCFTWQPRRGSRWDAIWHDVWQDLCVDNLEEMNKLHRRFGRRCDWQGSWGRELLRARRRRERRQERMFGW
jgi:hypothetical protein